MYQDDFHFDEGPPFDNGEAPYQPHSDTSREAAEAIEPDAATLRGQVLSYIRGQGNLGATDEEVQVALHMNPSTQRPRRIELWRGGFVRDSGQRRLTRSSRWATVWIERERT